MRAARFFIDAPLAVHSRVELPRRVAHHALRVLRLRDGDPIVLFNGHGGEFTARLIVNGARAFAGIEGSEAIERESPLAVTLVQAWIATDKLDWVIEKSVELGVHSIVLTPAARSVVRVAPDRIGKRLERLNEIIVSACAQCGRNRVPIIEAAPTLRDGLHLGLRDGATGVFMDPNGNRKLPAPSVGGPRVALAVGPEGGFDDDELVIGRQLGYYGCRLGPRVLRTETAGLAALAALQTIAGDFR